MGLGPKQNSQEKLVLPPKTNFYLGKRWLRAEKANFFLAMENPTFPKEKDGFGLKTDFFQGKKRFWARRGHFLLGKTKKTIVFGVWPDIFQKIILGKLGFLAHNHLLPRQNWCFKTKLFPAKSIYFICLRALRISVANSVRVSLLLGYGSA